MKLIDIIKHGAELLDLNETINILKVTTEENEEEALADPEIQRLISLSALSIQELCSNYLSVMVEQEIETVENKFPLKNLHNYVRIINVYDNGNPIKFKILNRNIVLEKDGNYVVKYCCYPSISSLFDEIDFLSELSPDVIVMGLCAYYAVAHGMYNEFDMFHEQYINRAQSLKELSLFELPLRRWE